MEKRVRELETKQKKDIYERYFPKSPPDEPQHSSSAYHHHPSHLVISGCACSTQGLPQEPRNRASQNDLERIVNENVKHLEALRDMTTALDYKLGNLINALKPEPSVHAEATLPTSHQENVIPDHVQENNTSHISIDDDIHDISMEALNSIAQTTQ